MWFRSWTQQGRYTFVRYVVMYLATAAFLLGFGLLISPMHPGYTALDVARFGPYLIVALSIVLVMDYLRYKDKQRKSQEASSKKAQ